MSSVDESSKTHVLPQQPTAANEAPAAVGGDVVFSDIVKRGKREDLLRRSSLWLRGIGLLFSFIGFIVMASNKHGGMNDFNKYEEYRYVLAVTILSTVYTTCQVLRPLLKLPDVKGHLHPKMMLLIDFLGDQIMAYLLISAASSAAPITTRLRENTDITVSDNILSDPSDDAISKAAIFSDSSAAAISMSVLAFFCLALSAPISFYKLSTHPFI